MAVKIVIRKYGHCSNCEYYEAGTTTPDGGERTAESSERGSADEAIGRLVQQNSDIFGEIEIEHEGEAKAEHDRMTRIIDSLKLKVKARA